MIVLLALVALLQFPVPFSSPSSNPGGIQQSAIFTSAPITLSGQTLFRIAVDTTGAAGQTAILNRQTTIETALEEALTTVTVDGKHQTAYDPATFKVLVQSQNGETFLAATDRRHVAALALLTVTSDDAQYNGATVSALAKSWQAILQTNLEAALLQRQPLTVARSIRVVEEVGAGLVLFSVGIIAIAARLRKRAAELREQQEERERELEAQKKEGGEGTAPHQQRRHLLALALRGALPKRRRGVVASLASALLWLTVVLWFAAIVWGLGLFPQTTPFAHTLSRGAVAVVGIWVIFALFDRIGNFAIDRFARLWERRAPRGTEDHARTALRTPTIVGATAGAKTGILAFIAILASLGEIGVPVASVVTIGGLVAVAISLAAQNFVRDFLNGFLVLFEDQYVIGDFITISGTSGIVERLTLRMVQLRDGGGSLVTIPHSSVTSVQNHSRDYSRVDYLVSIDPASDPAKALAVLRTTLESMAGEKDWRDAIRTPIEFIGIAAFSHDYTLLRASVKTAPLRQYDVRREINERVRGALLAVGIGFGPAVAADAVPLA